MRRWACYSGRRDLRRPAFLFDWPNDQSNVPATTDCRKGDLRARPRPEVWGLQRDGGTSSLMRGDGTELDYLGARTNRAG